MTTKHIIYNDEFQIACLTRMYFFMAHSVEYLYIDYKELINLIDFIICLDNIEHPYTFIDLSLAKSCSEFISILYTELYKKSEENYYEKNIGFLVLSYREKKISKSLFRSNLIDSFDVDPLDFSIEELHTYFETNNDLLLSKKIKQYLIFCSELAKIEMVFFRDVLSSLQYPNKI